MKEFFKKYKIYITASALVVLIVAFSYGGIFCLIRNIRSNADEVQKKMIDSEINQNKFAKIPQMQKTFEEINEHEKRLTGILREHEEVDFIKKLEVLAEETQNEIDLKIIEETKIDTTKKKVKDEPVLKLPSNDYITLQANLEGNYSNLFNFIKKLENFEYYVNIISISSSVEEEKAEVASNRDPFASATKKIGASNVPEISKKFLLKTQINFVAYIDKK